MKKRDLVWASTPLVCVLQFLGHEFLWLASSCMWKIFQLIYRTGYIALVLLEISRLQSFLMGVSFVVFRMKTSSAALR